METLENWLKNPNLSQDARQAMLDALELAKKNRQLLRELLGKLDPSLLTDEEYKRLKEEAEQNDGD